MRACPAHTASHTPPGHPGDTHVEQARAAAFSSGIRSKGNDWLELNVERNVCSNNSKEFVAEVLNEINSILDKMETKKSRAEVLPAGDRVRVQVVPVRIIRTP
jgi:hypothetical protein